MNLVLDFGNTRIKAACFKEHELAETKAFDSVSELLGDTMLSQSINHCMIASVTQDHLQVLNALKNRFPVYELDSETKLPIRNLYQSPKSLGPDRLLSSIGSFSLFPNRNVLTVDAGTCIKYNFVNQNNEFLGGAISPGIPMRLKAMHRFTAALPELEFNPDYTGLLGNDTSSSLLSGAQIGAACEVEEMIRRYAETYEELQVVLTGGDGEYLCKQLKKAFFANPNLLLIGLHTLLLHQIEN